MDYQENKVEIAEDVVATEEKFDVEGLMPEEVEMAKEVGLIEEEEGEDGEEEDDDGEQQESTTDEAKEDSKEDENEEEINTDPDNFEEMEKVQEKDEKKFHEKYTSNQKALYFKSKADKHKRQEAIKERDELRTKLKDLEGSSMSKSKLDKINELLSGDELPTAEELKAVINEKVEEKKEEPIKAEDIAIKVQERNKYIKQIGLSKYDNFEEIVGLAMELYNQDADYRNIIDGAYMDENNDESTVVDKIVKVAKFNPKYEELGKKKLDSKDTSKVDRVIKNSKKKVSSASVGGSGKRIISESELTVDQAEKLTPNQFAKLKPKTQERLLMGIDP